MITITETDRRKHRLESELATAVRERLTRLGAVVVKIHGDAFQQRAVDMIICYRGKYVAIELKVGKNAATPHQAHFLERVQAAGGVGVVAWTVADCLEALQQLMG